MQYKKNKFIFWILRILKSVTKRECVNMWEVTVFVFLVSKAIQALGLN